MFQQEVLRMRAENSFWRRHEGGSAQRQWGKEDSSFTPVLKHLTAALILRGQMLGHFLDDRFFVLRNRWK